MNAETKKVIKKDYWIYIMMIIVACFIPLTITSQMNVSGKVVDKELVSYVFHNTTQYRVTVETTTPRGKTRKKVVSVGLEEYARIYLGMPVCLNCSEEYKQMK